MHVTFTWAGTAHMLGRMMHMYEPQEQIPNKFLDVAHMQ